MASPTELTNYFGPVCLVIGGVWAYVKWWIGRKDKRRVASQTQAQRDQAEAVKNDANLRDDQREFIVVLQRENAKWRAEVDSLRSALDQCRAQIEQLRTELATERRAREASEARYLQILERDRPVNLQRPPRTDGAHDD